MKTFKIKRLLNVLVRGQNALYLQHVYIGRALDKIVAGTPVRLDPEELRIAETRGGRQALEALDLDLTRRLRQNEVAFAHRVGLDAAQLLVRIHIEKLK